LVTCYYMLRTSLLTCNFWCLFDLHTTINQKVIGLDIENDSQRMPVRRTTDSAIIHLKSWPSCFKCHAMYILNILLVVFNVEMLLKVILAFLLAVTISRLNWNFKWGSHFFRTQKTIHPSVLPHLLLLCHSIGELLCFMTFYSISQNGWWRPGHSSFDLRFRRKKLGSLFHSTKLNWKLEKISFSVRTGELTIFAEIENENIFHFHFRCPVRTCLRLSFYYCHYYFFISKPAWQ
jgi:hypothetical protein